MIIDGHTHACTTGNYLTSALEPLFNYIGISAVIFQNKRKQIIGEKAQ